jgi:hypothetical protein
MVEQNLASPLFLNNVVASLLLQREDDVYPLVKLVEDCQTLFQYFRFRGIDTFMTQSPSKKSIERVLDGLGYKVKTVKKMGSTKIMESVVSLGKKAN